MAERATGPAAQPANDHVQAKPERDADGRFVKGNRGGPGNPFARRVAELRRELLEAVSADDTPCLPMCSMFHSCQRKSMRGPSAAFHIYGISAIPLNRRRSRL